MDNSRDFLPRRSVPSALLLLLLLLSVSSCQKGAGNLRQDCYPNGTCNTGLVCASGTCVPEAAAPSASEPSSATGEAPSAVEPSTATGEAPSAVEPSDAAKQGVAVDPVVQAATQALTDALTTYRAHYAAWNAYDAEAYFGNYAPVIACYYNDANSTVAKVRRGSRGRHFDERGDTRLQIGSLEVTSASPDQVEFLDRGTYTDKGVTKHHLKGIVMQKLDGVWRITAEASRSAHSCETPAPPAAAAAVRAPSCAEFVACYERCDDFHETDEDYLMPCRRQCDDRFEPFGGDKGCVRKHNPATHPCDALDECKSLCITACPFEACNGAEECASDCAEIFENSCARARR